MLIVKVAQIDLNCRISKSTIYFTDMPTSLKITAIMTIGYRATLGKAARTVGH